jgi:hypothetical protein
MDEKAASGPDADPRRSIVAFLEAARREGLLSDSDAETLGAFHRRLLSEPSAATAPATTEKLQRAAARLIGQLTAAEMRLPKRGRSQTSQAIATLNDAISRGDAAALESAMSAGREALEPTAHPAPPAPSAPSRLIPEGDRRAARTLMRELAVSRGRVLTQPQRDLIESTLRSVRTALERQGVDELRAAIATGHRALQDLEPASAAKPARIPDETRRAAERLIPALQNRYRTLPRRRRDRYGVAIRALSAALRDDSTERLYRAMNESMALLDIQPVAHAVQAPPAPSPAPPVPSVAPEPTAPPLQRPADRVETEPRPAPPKPPPPTPARPTPASVPPSRPTAPPRPVRTGPSRFEIFTREAGRRSKNIWSQVTADVAAHTFTYLGVVLSIAVVYVFYAQGYFGDRVHEQHRPLWFIGTLLLFFGMARMLRRGTSIPSTATAVEIIGLLALPIMLSAFFRDGCDTGDHLSCVVPEIQGAARWVAYAGVGAVTAAIYYAFARRHRLYAYMVAPMVWMTVGSLGLYLEDGLGIIFDGDPMELATFENDGISGWQLIAVLAAMALTIVAAQRFRKSAVGKVIAVPSVRAAVVTAPFMLAFSFVFAYFNDTLGGADPSLRDLGATNIAALLAAAGVFGFGSVASFAWKGISARVQRESANILRTASYVAVGAAWIMSAAYELSLAWIGLGLLVYGIAVAVVDARTATTHASGIWIARVTGAVGAAMALIEPLPALVAWSGLAVPGLLGGRIGAIESFTARVLPLPDVVQARRLRLWVPLFVALGAGASRLAWPDGTAWVVAAAAAAFALARFVPGVNRDIAALARFPAAATGLAALTIEMGLQAGGVDGMGAYELGGFLISVAAIAAIVHAPWSYRMAPLSALAAAGTSILLREALTASAREQAWIDTSVLAGFGLILIAGVLFARPKDAGVWQGLVGHGFVLAALGRSLAFEQTALLGLGAVAVAYAAEAAAIELDRPGLIGKLAAQAGRAEAAIKAVPALVVAAVLPPLALLVGRQVPFIRDQRPRFGPVLAALSWIYLAGARLRTARVRRVVVPFAYAAALAGVAVAVPSSAAVITTTWSAAVVTAGLAIFRKRPYATTLSWGFAVAATAVTAVRIGLDRTDVHFVLHAAALLLLLVPAALNFRPEREPGLASPWLRSPVAIGLLLLPASLALGISDERLLAVLAVTAAAAYAGLGWSTRTGGVSIPASFSLAIGYAHLLFDNDWAHPFDEPLVWMPLSAVYVALSAILPGRRSWRILERPAPGMFVSGLALSAFALVLSVEAGATDLVLTAQAGVLGIAYVARRHDVWLAAAVGSLAAAGLVAGDYWAPLVAATAAIASAVGSERYPGTRVGTALQWISMGWWAAAFGLLGAWQNWSEKELVVAAAIAGAVTLTTSAVLLVVGRLPDRARRWAIPVQALGQAAAATVIIASGRAFSVRDAYGALAGVAAAQAFFMGLIGTVRRNATLVPSSAALAATAYGLAAYWQDWSAETVVSVTAIVGGTLLAMWTLATLARFPSERLRLWVPSWGVLSQVAAITLIVVAGREFGDAGFYGVIAAVAAAEAIPAGLIGTVRRNKPSVAVSAALLATSYGFAASWLELDAPDLIGITSIVGGVLLSAFTIAFLRTSLAPRVETWLYPVGALAHAAGITVLANAWTYLNSQEAAGVTAGVAAAEALMLALLATVRRMEWLVPPATMLAGVAYGFFAAWADWPPETLIAVTASVGAALLVAWEIALLRGSASGRIRMWIPAIGAAGVAAAVAVLAIAASELSVTAAYGVASGVAAFTALLAGTIGHIRREPIVVGLATLAGATAYGFLAAWQEWTAETLIAVSAPIGAVLSLVAVYAFLTGSGAERTRLWLPSVGAAGQGALVAAAVAAATLTPQSAYAVLAGLALFEGILFGIAGTVRRDLILVSLSTAFIAVAYGFGLAAAEMSDSALVAVTAMVATGVAAGATLLTRSAGVGSRTSLWTWPAHGLAVAAGIATAWLAIVGLALDTSFLVIAAVAFGAGLYAALNVAYAPAGWPLPIVAALAHVSSAGFLLAWSNEAGSGQQPALFGIAALGLFAAAVSSAKQLDHGWRKASGTAAVGWEVVALIAAWVMFEFDGVEFASTLLIAGAALAVHGLLARRLLAIEAALIAWLIAGLALVDEQLTLTLHSAVVLVSAMLLAVFELERHRRRLEDLPPLDLLSRAEWILMIAPMSVAAYGMGDRLWFGLIMFAEGLLLTGWGAVSRVRRRAFIGFGGMVLAILLAVAIPTVQGIKGGVGGGTWLVVGAIAAVVFIVVGSTIERQRVAIGRRLRQVGEIVEDWE